MALRRRDDLIGAGLLLALGIGLAAFFLDRHPDQAYILYRYARNFATGRGLAYNPGPAPFLSGAASAPYAILLAIGTLLTVDIPTLANLLGALFLGLGAWLLMRLAAPAGKLPALIAAGAYLTFPLMWVTLGLETPLWLALCMAAIASHLRGSGRSAAIFLGLATLVRAEAALLVLVLAAHSLLTRRPIEFLPPGIYIGIAGFGGLVLLSSFQKGGVFLPYTASGLAQITPGALGDNLLSGLAGLGIALFSLSPPWAALLILAGAGLARIKTHPWAALLACWAGLRLVLLGVIGAGIFPWDLAPLAAPLAALIALGVEWIQAHLPAGRYEPAVAGGIGLLVAATGAYSSLVIAVTPPLSADGWRALAVSAADPRVESAAGWLRRNAPPGATVGTTHVGLLGYRLDQPMLDYYGALQPDLGEAAARGDPQWWLMAYGPDYLVVDARELQGQGGDIVAQDDWFSAAYLQVAGYEAARNDILPGDPILIFQRTTPAQPVTSTLIGFVTYPGGLTLNGIASDFSLFPMEGGRPGLVRLEWLLDAPPESPQSVTIRIQGRGEGAVAGLATRSVDFSKWPLHRLITTFHPIQLAPGLPSGVYDVAVGIGPDADHQTWKNIAVAKVPFKGGMDLGGISGTRIEFGDIALLGYRVGQRPEGLEVFFLWQAARAVAADYHMVIEVRDAQGTVTASRDVQPHNGAYPTSVWSAGEQVTDTVILDVSRIPSGEYDVYVSLTTPDGNRVRAAGGQDAVFIGHVKIGS